MLFSENKWAAESQIDGLIDKQASEPTDRVKKTHIQIQYNRRECECISILF